MAALQVLTATAQLLLGLVGVGAVRTYAYDTLNFGRFCLDRQIGLDEVGAGDMFDWIDWQSTSGRPRTVPAGG